MVSQWSWLSWYQVRSMQSTVPRRLFPWAVAWTALFGTFQIPRIYPATRRLPLARWIAACSIPRLGCSRRMSKCRSKLDSHPRDVCPSSSSSKPCRRVSARPIQKFEKVRFNFKVKKISLLEFQVQVLALWNQRFLSKVHSAQYDTKQQVRLWVSTFMDMIKSFFRLIRPFNHCAPKIVMTFSMWPFKHLRLIIIFYIPWCRIPNWPSHRRPEGSWPWRQ